MKNQRTVALNQVSVKDGFWSPLQKLVVETVLPYQADALEDRVEGAEKSHAIENFRIAAGDSKEDFYGMVFQDSDLAKWLEAVAYSLIIKPNTALEQKADEVIALIGRAQESDGYLNTYFILKEPEHKWQNLQECHELYCAGHMIEAAVAYKEATGKDSFLNIMCKTADLICSRFGKGKVRGYPGHQEIELALLRLYRMTGKQEYLDTARYFLDERGTEPEYFQEEVKQRDWAHFHLDPEDRKYAQVHAPVRQQEKAVGHAVRATYMYTAMADLAAETEDQELREACRRLWNNIVNRQMYITGGIGATVHGEAFSIDYELPNDLIYAETCASVAMVFFARRMLEMEVKGEYADILEKELYNGILSGMQLNGRQFFYVNPLEVVPGVSGVLPEYKHVLPERPKWYGCACCPPNVSRLLTSLGEYAWGENQDGVFAHTFLGGTASFQCGGGVQIDCKSAYPWNGAIQYTIHPSGGQSDFFFAVHIPGWCKNISVSVNGEAVQPNKKDGYAYLERQWHEGDTVDLKLEMEVQRMYANPKVRADAGCVALMRGPVVYCFEETDNGGDLAALRIPRETKITVREEELSNIGKVPVLTMEGLRLKGGDALYCDKPFESKPVTLRAVPYYAWGNRKPGGMRVWMVE